MGRYVGGMVTSSEFTSTSGLFSTDELYQSKAAGIPAGQVNFSGGTTQEWTAPKGVTSISLCLIGGGGASSIKYEQSQRPFQSGGGGFLTYKNNITVTPYRSYYLTIGAGGSAPSPQGSSSSRIYAQGTSTAGGHSAWAQGTVAFAIGGGGGTGGSNAFGQANTHSLQNSYNSDANYRGYGQQRWAPTYISFVEGTRSGLRIGDGGGRGAPGVGGQYQSTNPGGGGAGGYSGDGGIGGGYTPDSSDQRLSSAGSCQGGESNSGASSGGASNSSSYYSAGLAGNGGSTGTGGKGTTGSDSGLSAGGNGNNGSPGDGGNGGGGAGATSSNRGPGQFGWGTGSGRTGIAGAGRIIWAGTSGITRAYPDTNTGNQ